MLCGVQRSQRASARTTLPRSGPRAADCASTQWEQACLSPATRQSPTREATRVLAQPISKEDFESSKARIEARRSGKESHQILEHRAHQPAQRKSCLTAIEATDGDRRPASPGLQRCRPCHGGAAGRQACRDPQGPRAGARDVRHDDDQPWEGRTPPPQTKPHTAKASDAQTLRGIYENASGDDDRGP
jgi:hypothetical protein